MTVHPHFRRVHHLLYRTDTGVIFGCETSPSKVLPPGWGSISVDDLGRLPTSKTHRIEVSVTPHTLVELTASERAEANRPSGAEVLAAVAQELATTDQFMVPDRPMTDDKRAAWAAYRQALRDLSKVDPARGRVRTTVEMVQDWPVRPDSSDPVAHLRSRT